MRGSSQKGLVPSTTGDQTEIVEGELLEGPIRISDLPLEGPETVFVPVPLTSELAVELAAYAKVTGQTLPRAGLQLLEIGMRAQSQWTGVARADLQRSAERRVD